MDLFVMAAECSEKGIDAKAWSFEFLIHKVPFVIVEYHNACPLHQRPSQDRVAIDVRGHMAAIDVGEIEAAPGNAKFREDGGRVPLHLFDSIGESRHGRVELAFGLQRELDPVGIEAVLDVATKGVDAHNATVRKVVQKEQCGTT